MGLAQRNAATEKAKFHRVATNRRTGVFDLGTLHQAEHHQALNLWIRGIYCPDNASLAAFQGG